MPPKKTTTKPAQKTQAKPAAKKTTTVKASGKATEAKSDSKETSKVAVGGASASDKPETELPELQIVLKQLANVVLDDTEHKVKDSGKWPLLIDEAERAVTFLRYRNANFIQVLNESEMEPEYLRKALLGAIRFGKPLVIDMMNVDMYEKCHERFDEIEKGLMDSIMDKSIVQEEKYLSLVRPNDGDEYKQYNFNPEMVESFKFIITTALPQPSDVLRKKLFPIRVEVPT